MSPQQETHVSKQIKLSAWGLGLAIVTTFGGGAIFIVRELVGLEHRLTVNESLQTQVNANTEAIKVVNVRIDNQEGRMFNLAELIKSK